MSSQFDFRANQITTSLPENDNFVSGNSDFNLTTQPAADPVSDAINNVRFACNGSTGHGVGDAILFTLRTFHTFSFRPSAVGILTAAHTHFMPQGDFSLTARQPTWIFDGPGFVSFNILMSMRLRVFNTDNIEVVRSFRRNVNIFSAQARAGSLSVSNEGVVEADLLEFTMSRSAAIQVGFFHRVEVQARYTVQVLAIDGADFAIDFDSVAAIGGDPGDGLNAPFAVINIAE
jgi:hypothetical protein